MGFPRENLYRACMPGAEVRAAEGGGMPTLFGHFAVFSTPTTISSAREGTFLETVAPGAFKKTMLENRNAIKVMFNHGRDPQIGEKPLGALTDLREDETGGFYEAELLDTSYNRDLIPALKAGLLGASFRFSVVREDVVDRPKRSAANPDGIPERTIREARLYELGPVVNPAYASATAGVRSITDYIADVDAIIAATPILLDDERIMLARGFLTLPTPEERRDYTADERKQLAKEGKALPDGSFPIVTVSDLHNAIAAYGRASDKAAAKAHIIKRAEALGATSALPDGWRSAEAPTDSALRADSTNAPSDSSAEPTGAHPARERRVPTTREPLFGSQNSRRKPSWLL